MNPEDHRGNGVAYGAQPLKGRAEFEVKIIAYGTHSNWYGSLQCGVMRCNKGAPIESSPSILVDSSWARDYCVWAEQRLYNNLVTPREKTDYGYVNLQDLREGDRVGLRLSPDGVLEFFVNGESQGVAAKNIYTRDTDVYAVVDHIGKYVATVITKAGGFKCTW